MAEMNFDMKKMGWFCVIIGILVLLNQYVLHWSWWTFVGIVIILKGLVLMGGCCACAVPKRRRR